MNFSLRPHQLIAHWVPGFMLLLAVQLWRPAVYCTVLGRLPSDRVALSLVWVTSAFVLGQVLDSLRDLSEGVWNRLGERVDWDFFFRADRAKVDQLEDFYFTYYVFNANLVLPLIAFFLVAIGFKEYLPAVVIVVGAAILICDARSLRQEIAKRTQDQDHNGLPGSSSRPGRVE